VIATLDRIKDPKTAAYMQAYVTDNIVAYEALDPFTLRVTLKAPDVIFLNFLAHTTSYIVSADDVQKDLNILENHNGTGPLCSTTGSQAGRSCSRRTVLLEGGPPYLDKLILMPIDEEQPRVDALRSGEVD